MSGSQFSLPGDAVTFLAWGNDPVLPARIEGEDVREVANVLYQVPLAVHDLGLDHVPQRPPAEQRRQRRRQLLHADP